MSARNLGLTLAGFLIAVVGAMCGIGGGLFAVPLLHFACGLDLKRAVATALVLVLSTTTFATLGECLRETPDLHASLVACVAAGVLLGAQFGFRLAERISLRALQAVFVVVLLGAAARIALGGADAAAGAQETEWLDHSTRMLGFAAGLAGGFLAPLLGVGGGLIMVPALFLGIGGLGFTEARATSLAAGAVGAMRSLWLHGRAGRVELPAVLPLALGAVGGSLVGVRLVHLEGAVEVSRMLLAGVLVFVALRFLRELLGPRN